MAYLRAPLYCHFFDIQLQKQAHSILSGIGSWQCIENGVTRDSTVKAGTGRLTGRGNRRPEVISDVISGRRKSISIGGIWGIPIQLVSPLTNVGQEKCSVGSMWNKIKIGPKGSSVVSLSEPAWSLNVCFDDVQLNWYMPCLYATCYRGFCQGVWISAAFEDPFPFVPQFCCFSRPSRISSLTLK